MTSFSAQVSQNQYLAQGADLVHAVMSVSSGSATAPATAPGHGGPGNHARRTLVEALIVDCSGSMDGEKIMQTRQAVNKAIDLLHDDAWFCVIAGSAAGKLLVPLAQATPENRQSAEKAVRHLGASGGTAMSTWLQTALHEFHKMPDGIHHALLLTDGKDESEGEAALDDALEECEGRFQCDARGVGTDWQPAQLRKISAKLLGTLDIIPSPDQIEADFRRVIESAMGKSVGNVSLRLWTPVGATVEFCRLVYPEQFDLTDRAVVDPKTPQVRDYPTGAWGEEKRDYHLAIRVTPGKVGQRMCAGRASLVVSERGQETKVAESMVLAVWTDDEAQSALIHPAVAHYTGQVELASAIQQGLKAREQGDEARATQLLGRAVQIAAASNPDTMKLLRKVVEVEDERQGTVKLRRNVKKEDEFALDARSTKTARVQKPS
ncbi:MAG: VWA domain-containing protein [Thermoguttaceae bacterium]